MSTTTIFTPTSSRPTNTLAFPRIFTYASILGADLAAFLTAGGLSVLIRYVFHGDFAPSMYFDFLPGVALFLGVFAIAGLYPGIAVNAIEEFRAIIRSSSVVFLLIIGATFFIRQGLLASRIVFVLAWLLTILLVPLSRRLVRGWCSQHAWWGVPTVILGERDAAEMMLRKLESEARLGLRPIALLYEGGSAGSSPLSTQREIFLGDLTQSAMFSRHRSDCYAIIAMPLTGSQRMKAIFTEHADEYRRVLIIPDLFGMTSLSVKAKDVCGVLGLEVNHHLARPLSRLIKRCFDIAVSVTVALLLLPVLVLVYLAIRLSSPGSGFYGQRRIGRDDKEFTLWKFRTMRSDADQVLKKHLDAEPALRSEWERDHKLRRDPRVTDVGRLLRKISLDELPQLWNVLRGDMSLVGPRPIVYAEVKRYGAIFHQYRRVTPGLTGMWQVSGRNNTTYELRTQLDEYYVRNWSLSLDVYILFRTLKTVLFAEGAF